MPDHKKRYPLHIHIATLFIGQINQEVMLDFQATHGKTAASAPRRGTSHSVGLTGLLMETGPFLDRAPITRPRRAAGRSGA